MSLSFISSLSERILITVNGPQAAEYLHGQLTVATKDFDSSKARLAAHCDFKGKMFASMFVSHVDDTFYLSMQKDAGDQSLAQLKKYGVFSKVDININTQYQLIGLAGNHAISALTKLFPNIDDQHLQVQQNKFGQCLCFNDTSLRYLCYLTNEACEFLLESEQLNQFDDDQAFECLEIKAGIADIRGENIGQFVPQMLNYQCIDAIDFDKGCYMGQEVVARTKFLGKNKRATFILEGAIQKDEVINSGDLIELKMGDNWRRAGTILKAASQTEAAPDHQTIWALAVMANDIEPDSVVRLKDSEQTFIVKMPPYSLTE